MTRDLSLRLSFWTRWRFQLPAGIIIAALIPYISRIQFGDISGDISVNNNTLIGVIVSIIAGFWLMRNVGTFPGSEGLATALPAFCAAFGALLMIYVFARIPYNRTGLLAGFALSITWFFIVSVIENRHHRLRIGILPFGNFSSLQEVPNIHWRILSKPSDDVIDLDAIVVDLRIDLPDMWERQLTEYALARMPVYHTKHLIESLTGRVELEHLSENSLGSLVPRQDYMRIKHVIDWISAFLCLLILLPLLIIVGLIVQLTSDGPALFRQERIGYQGKPFIVYKFRTMRSSQPGARDERDLAITRTDDSRVTPVGRFLRKSRIDELPQLINVLRGEMSWIGPRPEATILSRWYEQEIPFYRYRHIVRPGIAGWAQVCQGHVAEVDEVRSKLHYDFYYIKRYSLWIDLLIVVRTIRIMINGYGAR